MKDQELSLSKAILSGEITEVSQILCEEVIINPADSLSNCRWFKMAVKSGSTEMVRLMLQHGIVPVNESPIFSVIHDVSNKCNEGFNIFVEIS